MDTLKTFISILKNQLERSNDHVLICNSDCEIVYINKSFLLSNEVEINKFGSDFYFDKKTKKYILDELERNNFAQVSIEIKTGSGEMRRDFYAFEIERNSHKVGVVFMAPNGQDEKNTLKKNLFQFSILKAMNSRNDAVYYITEIATGKNIYISESIQNLFGFNPIDFHVGGWIYFFSLVHPEDLENLIARQSDWVIMKNKLGLLYEHVESFNYFRMKNARGEYLPVETESNVLEKDKEGKVHLIFGSFRLVDEKTLQLHAVNKQDSPVKIINGKSYVEIDYIKTLKEFNTSVNFKRKFTELTPREMETLELIIDENSSEEIAKKLNISIHTVNLHRKMIMKKLGAKNIASLMKIYYTNKQ